ncbi:MAG: hypothetical protein ACPG31_13950, partial [Planctomycetota bacterium]
KSLITALSAAAFLAAPLAAQTTTGEFNILVFNQSANKDFAETAANNLYPGQVTVAIASNFNSLLAAQTWDGVFVDCPSTIPSTGWGPLVDYVNGGGTAILSFWDWDDPVDAVLLTPFDVSAPITFGLTSQTLTDLGTSNVFLGVTMPNSEWTNSFGDDGDQFTPLAGALGLAHLGDPNKPVMVLGNEGRTIATFIIDEAGNTWIGDGSGVRLWENMIEMVMDREPGLEVTDIVPGEFMTITVDNMPLASHMHLVLSSLGAGPTITPAGVLEVSQPWRRSPAFPADASGSYSFTSTLPAGSSGVTFYMQAVVILEDSSFELSNPLQVPIP